MDGGSPIQAYLAGDIGEDELLAQVDRVLADGSIIDRAALLNDWKTKSGRIRAASIRDQLNARVQALAWPEFDDDDTISGPSGPRVLKAGDVLARRFVIQERIGSGGMGSVFKARDLRREEAQDRQPYVAVKTLNVDLLRREDSLKILQREARKAQSLSHPNIVRVYDFDRDDQIIFLTMELLEGLSLEAKIRANGLLGTSLQDALPILEQVASALEFAHAERIIHSDLKPANVFILNNGRVKVIDFGIARAVPTPGTHTMDRTTFDVQALGALTPAYASPEMIEGLDPDPRDDVFAFACIAYELLTGTHPFGRTPALAARAANLQPRKPAQLLASQWRALQGGLALERSKRTASPAHLIAAMQSKPAIWQSRGFAVQAGAGFVVLAMLIGLWVYFAKQTGSPPGQHPAPLAADQQQAAGAPEAAKRQARQQTEAAAQKQAEEAAAQRLVQQQAEEAAAQRLAQQQAQEEAARRQEQQQAEEETAKRLAQQQAEEEAARRLAEQQAEELAKRQAQQQTAVALGPADIAELQRLLNAIGLNVGTPDGKAGPRTQEMIRAFQLASGEPGTGEPTPALLESLRRARPSADAKAKAVLSLAAGASRSRRTGDAIRLFELALTFAPADSDALLALGDLYRDNGGYEAARRQYELLQRNGGSAANTARQRLASLPRQEAPSNRAEPAAPDTTTSRAPTNSSAPTGGVESDRPFDGLYAGTSQLLGFSSPNCIASAVRLEVRNGKLSFARDRQAIVASDGTFSGTNAIGRPPVVQFWAGKIAGNSMEVDVNDPACKYHISLKKVP
jgi:peptidoglycan hydrolase-like protein with peptidoglycan-binding domain/tRNA A-37 threonylcarbamoyl transferase component Bud32